MGVGLNRNKHHIVVGEQAGRAVLILDGGPPLTPEQLSQKILEPLFFPKPRDEMAKLRR
jgi:hypothetical protein